MKPVPVENDQTHDPRSRTALGTLLIEAGILDRERLDEAVRIGAETGERLGEVIVRRGWASEEDVARTLAAQWDLRFLERSAISFDEQALTKLTREEAMKLEALPMRTEGDGTVLVALAEPTESRIESIRTLLGDNATFVVIPKSALESGLRGKLLGGDGPSQGHAEANGSEPAAAAAPVDPSADARAFDEVAGKFTAAVGDHLGSLRQVVVDVQAARDEAQRKADEALQRVSELEAELAQREESLQSLQGTLRDLADRLEPTKLRVSS